MEVEVLGGNVVIVVEVSVSVVLIVIGLRIFVVVVVIRIVLVEGLKENRCIIQHTNKPQYNKKKIPLLGCVCACYNYSNGHSGLNRRWLGDNLSCHRANDCGAQENEKSQFHFCIL